MFSPAAWSLLLSVAATLLVAAGAVRLAGTTLAPPAWWAVGSLVLIAVVALVLPSSDGLSADRGGPLEYAAAAIVLCPMMAVLGAKRPQDRAWQWVVLALLATLWLPAAKALLLDDGAMELFPAWQVFVGILILLGPLNYLPTRNWLPALLVAAGQIVLLAPFLPVLSAGEWRLPAAMSGFVVAGLIVWLQTSRMERENRHEDPFGELNAAWFRFRDAFGAFWAVRVLQRVNQGMHAAGSCLELTWAGWSAAAGARQASGSDDDPETALDLASRTLRTVLRRFGRRV